MQITIEYKGVLFDVDFDYQPYEKPVMRYTDGTGYPGCSEYIEAINEFKHKGTCFLEFIEGKEDEVMEYILDALHS